MQKLPAREGKLPPAREGFWLHHTQPAWGAFYVHGSGFVSGDFAGCVVLLDAAAATPTLLLLDACKFSCVACSSLCAATTDVSALIAWLFLVYGVREPVVRKGGL